MTAKKKKWSELTVAEATERLEKEFGAKFQICNKTPAELHLGFEKRRNTKAFRDALRDAYCSVNSVIFRVIILRHPDCPEDVKNMQKVIEGL